ncbi:MAG: hypothetical protein Q4A64_03345 [Porphyromonadaceae bacterium]|nr:hypothetical protein [Porphyromonadaceae bacterium]
MKKLLLMLLAVMLVGVNAHAQEVANKEEQTKSKNELFQKRSGSLITTTTYDLGNVASVDFSVRLAKDELSGEKLSFLILETKYYSSYSDSQTYPVGLDDDEVVAAIKALEYIRDNLITNTPEHYTETTFKSRDGARVGAFVSDKKWKLYVKTNASSQSLKTFDTSKLGDFIDKLKEASGKISELSK